MKTPRKGHSHASPKGPSQRQLRAGELVRHALVEILRHEELDDPALAGASVTVTEVRLSPDFRHAVVFVEPLGAGLEKNVAKAEQATAALNRAAKFLRGRLSRAIDLRTIPDLKFVRDSSFDIAAGMNELFANPLVRRDLDKPEDEVDFDADGAPRGYGAS
jgi:ribosome-binding factor A